MSLKCGCELSLSTEYNTRKVLNPGDFMFSFDLKSGYHHVEIFPEHRQYLSFSWIFSSGVTRYFQFSVFSLWP